MPTLVVSDERLKGFRVEISNGNGLLGAAARLRDWLRERGLAGSRLSNLKPFASPSTEVQYQPGYRQQALEVARRMTDGAGVVAAPQLAAQSDVRVVIGHGVAVATRCAVSLPCVGTTPLAQADAAAVDKASQRTAMKLH